MPTALLLVLALTATESATEALRTRDGEIRASLPPEGNEVTPAARRRIESILTRAIDVRSMVQSAMGKRWSQLTESQRRRLVNAFESRFRRSSSQELDGYRTTKIQYQPEVAGDDGVVQVPTRVVIKGEPTEITYAMRPQDDGWRIVDISIDGVSTVENYRSSFNRIISKEGVEGLIKRLERGAPAKG